MLSLSLDLQTQAGFFNALQNNSIETWVDANKHLLDTVSQLLKEVKVPTGESKTVELCEFICNSFSSFFQILCKTEDIKRRRTIPGFSTIRKKTTLFESLGDAKNGRNEIFSPTVGKTDVGHIPSTSHELRGQFQTNQYISSTPVTGVIPTSSSNLCNTKRANKKMKKRGKMAQEVKEYESQMKAVMGEISSPIGEEILREEANERLKLHKTVTRKVSNTSITSDDFHFRRNAMNASFQRKLSSQNQKFSEELQKMKDKQERLNREAEEEMRNFRRESAMRIQMFLNCIQLKIRWEEQEREWSDWLRHTRESVIKVKKQFMEFDRIRRFEDEADTLSEATYFHKMVQTAYEILVYSFRRIDLLFNKYDEKLFLKVIQKKISDVATKLCNLMEELDNFQNTKQFYDNIYRLESEIDSMEIPTTTKLRQICGTASPHEYDIITPPKQPKSYSVITEELS
ncbi:unnamed protein product [Caenorhabditis brenneri]